MSEGDFYLISVRACEYKGLRVRGQDLLWVGNMWGNMVFSSAISSAIWALWDGICHLFGAKMELVMVGHTGVISD